jgi:hypothetical protein
MLNINEARAARAEAKGEAPVVEIDDETFTMPIELPIDVAVAIGRLSKASASEDNDEAVGALLDIVKALFGDAYDSFMAHRPSVQDIEFLMNGLVEQYGMSTGEAEASES